MNLPYRAALAAVMWGLAGPAAAFELKVAYQDTQPKYIIENGIASGLCHDIIVEMAGRAGVTFTPPTVFTPVKRMRQELEEGQVHLDCGVARDAEREQKFIFSHQPLYEVRNILVSLKERQATVTTLDQLETAQVGSLAGTSTADYLKSLGIKVNDALKSVRQALTLVESGRLDYFFYYDLGTLYTLKVDGTAAQFHINPVSFRDYKHWIMYARTLDPAVVAKLDAALDAMSADGTILRIRDRYR